MNREIIDRIFVFDIDGTLVGKDARIKKNVDKLFQSIFKKYSNPRIMFVSGGDTQKVNYSLDLISEEAGVDLSSAIRASHAGGRILDAQGNKIRPDKYFSLKLIQAVLKEVFSVDKYFYVVYCTSEGNFFVDMHSLEPEGEWVTADELKKVLYDTGIRLMAQDVTKDELKKIILDKKVRSLWVFNANHQYNLDADKLLQKLPASYHDLTVATSFFIDLTVSDKISAINSVFGDELEKIVYFGDEKNDEQALLNGKNGTYCGSIAVGKSRVAIESGDLAVPYFNDFAIKYAINELDDESICKIDWEDKTYEIKGKNLEETIKLVNEFTLKNCVKK